MKNTLPKKWYIEVDDDNRTILTEWVKKQPNFTNFSLVPVNGFVLSDSYGDGSYQYWGREVLISEGYKKITIEEFKKHVLNKSSSLPTEYNVEVSSYKEVNEVMFAVYGKKDYINEPYKGLLKVKEKFNGSHLYVAPNDLPKFTFAEWKTLFFNIKKKEIIGYKFIKSNYLDAADKISSGFKFQVENYNYATDVNPMMVTSGFEEAFRVAGVLDKWFEAVYEVKKDDIIKVGQWVVTTLPSEEKIENVYQVERVAIGARFGKSQSSAVTLKGHGTCDAGWVIREATDEDIEKSKIKLPKINGYIGELTKEGLVKYGCAKFTPRFFKDLNSMFYAASTSNEAGNRTVKSVRLSSDVEITPEEVKQIVDFLNNGKEKFGNSEYYS